MIVLYIGGAGRSGSTLIDMILGNLPGFFSIGETRFFAEYLARGDIACGCGCKLGTCDFWAGVKERLDSASAIDFDQMTTISKQLNRTRNLPRMVTRGVLGSPRGWKELVSDTEALYHAIWQMAESKVLVDASKSPSQAFVLRSVPGIDLRILHLVRDGRAVAYSWSKRRKQQPVVVGHKEDMPYRSAVRAMLAWAVENVFMARLSHATPYYTLMRYEDFVREPYSELGRALEKLGFGNVDLEFLKEPTISLSPTHGVGGNPIRFSKPAFSIAPDDEWHDRMSVIKRMCLGIMACPLLFRFGYRL